MFLTMLVLAMTPDASTIAVVARSLAGGMLHGVITVVGIIAGDIVFIVLAVLGLGFVAEYYGDLFYLIKLAGAAYLIWMGVQLWLSKTKATEIEPMQNKGSRLADFMTGFLITLGDPKAIIFYISFLPAFVELKNVGFIDVMLIVIAAGLAVSIPKLGYAWAAFRAKATIGGGKTELTLKRLGAVVLIGTAAVLVV